MSNQPNVYDDGPARAPSCGELGTSHLFSIANLTQDFPARLQSSFKSPVCLSLFFSNEPHATHTIERTPEH